MFFSLMTRPSGRDKDIQQHFVAAEGKAKLRSGLC